ncbi:hypothetical protein Mgra_00007560, partial [Meloidogyne graminicola]
KKFRRPSPKNCYQLWASKINLSFYKIRSILIIITTLIIFRFVQASKETAIKTHHPALFSAASFVDASMLRRKSLEAKAASVRNHLQRDVQAENIGGLLDQLPAINTINDAAVRIYAHINQQPSVSIPEENNYQTLPPSITTSTNIPSNYENLENPPIQQLNNNKRNRRNAHKQSPALLRCLREVALLDSLNLNSPEPPLTTFKSTTQAHARVNLDIAHLNTNKKVNNHRVYGHQTYQTNTEYSSGPNNPPSIHPPPTFHNIQHPNQRPPQFFVPASTQGGSEFQHNQQNHFIQSPPQPTNKIFVNGGEHGTAPQTVGILSGSTKNSNLPTMISLGGQKGHLPSISSINLPPGTNAHRYYYPPRMPLPLPTCFHNPTGYPCCNPKLNDLIVETYTSLESKPRFHTCLFNTSFETVAAFDDFAQKIHFAGDLVCKVELGGKYMLAYATVKDVSKVLVAEPNESEASNGLEGSESHGILSGRRKRRQTAKTNSVYGPQIPKPLNDLSRHYSIWV